MAMRWLAPFLLVLIAGCADTVARPSPPPPSPVLISPAAYLLRPSQVPSPLQRTVDAALSARQLADQRSDPALVARLQREGFAGGSRATYGLHANAPAALFATVNADAYLFSGTAGAHQFFREEAHRVDVASSGETIAPLAGRVTATGVDEHAAYAAAEPALHKSAFIFVARRGRMVVELYAEGDGPQTSATGFAGLVRYQEKDLAALPDL